MTLGPANAGAPAGRLAGREVGEAITAINVRRLWILSLLGVGIALAVLVSVLATNGWSTAAKVAVGDAATSSALVLVMLWLRRRPRHGRWVRVFVVALAAAWIAYPDAYFFAAFAAGTHNASYAIGVMCVAVVFLLPPKVFLPLLALNHAFYCVRLLQLAAATGRSVTAPLIDGSVSVILAALASWLLYDAVRANLAKERIVAERNQELAESNAELREVMAIAAHDLRTPLLGVKNLLDLTAVQAALPREQWLAVAKESSRTCGDMLRLVTRLVAAHEAEHPSEPEAARTEDLRALCQAAVERARLVREPKAISVKLVLPEEAALAMVPVDALADVLDNLLGNAVKFSLPEATVELALRRTAETWRIDVSDEGPGVPEGERADLFKKFRRGSAAPTGGESSTGLGLYIVKTRMGSMGGSVAHAPRHPRGSVFSVELPALPAA